MTPPTIILLAGFVLWVLVAPRLWALVGMVAGLLFLTQGQSLQIAGANFYPSRILVYACVLRVWNRKEFSFDQFTRLDRSLVILYGFVTVVLLIRPGESKPLAIARLMDVLFGYFSFRGLLRTPDEFRWFLRVLVFMLVPYVALLALESFTHKNPFAILGGNRAAWLRDGKLRCFGSFLHPSILGTLGASFAPVFIALMWDRSARRWALAGLLACLAIVVFSNSGGPLSAMAVAVAGWFVWPMRHRMRLFRRSVAAMLVVVGALMKAPIWYLPSRVSSITGGTGWHRSYLMDVAFRHFGEWWFLGMPMKNTIGWFPYRLEATGGADITNQYIAFGLAAGLLAVLLFIVVLVRGYSMLGEALGNLRESLPNEPGEERLVWGLGVMLTVHVTNWLGITYFDQFQFIWLLQLAAIASITRFWTDEAFEEDEDDEEEEDAESRPPQPGWLLDDEPL